MTWQTIVLSFVYMTHRITKGKQKLQKVITGKILRGNLQYKSKKLSEGTQERYHNRVQKDWSGTFCVNSEPVFILNNISTLLSF